MATKEERDARLDALESATEAWATAEEKRLKNQVAFSKRMLRGRTGSERLAQASVSSGMDLTINQINQFLTGD